MLSTNREFPSDRVLVLRSSTNIIPDPILHSKTVICGMAKAIIMCMHIHQLTESMSRKLATIKKARGWYNNY
jgi:hypothetical protein